MKKLIYRLFNIKQNKMGPENNETSTSSVNEQMMDDQKKNEAIYQKELKLEAQVKQMTVLNDSLQSEVENKIRLIESLESEIEKRDNKLRSLVSEIESMNIVIDGLDKKNIDLISEIDNQKTEIIKLNELIEKISIEAPSYNEKNPDNIKPLDYVCPKGEHKDFELGYNCRVVSVDENDETMIIKNHDNKEGHANEIEVNIKDFKKI